MKRALAILVVGLALAGTSSAGVTTFDDVTSANIKWGIPNGYDGFNWSAKWGVMKGTYYAPNPSGYANGVVSSEYVAFNSMGNPVEISAASPFDLVGAYFTAAWHDALLIEVKGYLGGDLVGSSSFRVDTTEPLWWEFGWTVDTVVFASSGGTPAWQTTGTQFAMDNLTTAAPAVPAPGAVLLSSLGAGLVGWLRRRRTL